MFFSVMNTRKPFFHHQHRQICRPSGSHVCTIWTFLTAWGHILKPFTNFRGLGKGIDYLLDLLELAKAA